MGISYETVRRWFLKFGTPIAANLRRARSRPSDHWHLNEMVVVIRRKRHWLWRAVHSEGEVLDFLVQRRRNAKAAKMPMKTLLKKQDFAPSRVIISAGWYYLITRKTLRLFRNEAMSVWQTVMAAA